MATYHLKELKKFCRVCGERISRNRVSFSCQQLADNIAQTFGVFCRDDCPDVHPPFICHGCFSVTLRSKAAAEEGKQYHHIVKPFSWTGHSPDQCTICDHFEKVSTGGRPKKMRRKPGRPATISTRSAIDYVHSIAPPSFPVNDTPARKVTQLDSNSVITAELVCKLCGRILDQPIQLTECNNLVCMNCLCTALEERGGLLCPCCSGDHLKDFSTMVHPTSVVMTVLGNHTVSCSLCKKSIASGTWTSKIQP